jgi:CDP-glucose 4,6-dehydratase
MTHSYKKTHLEQHFADIFGGRRVFVTGHTGFKGSWLTQWLLSAGAEVRGYALEPLTEPSLFNQLDLAHRMEHQIADVRDRSALHAALHAFQPDFVFHLAAQPLVVASYEEPYATFETNLVGTMNLMESLRELTHPCSAVIITSDKCYRNHDDGRAFEETDPLGGDDPYSASKGAMEIVVHSYRKSFFRNHTVRVATVRAGNVIGGGDYSGNRIVPDCVRALMAGRPIDVRNPHHTRPWQHVLEPLSGYLWLAGRLQAGWEDPDDLYAFNFGPADCGNQTVQALVEEILLHWPGEWVRPALDQHHEAVKLALSIRLAHSHLTWEPRWDFAETVAQTITWYREAAELSHTDTEAFLALTQRTLLAFSSVDE